MKKEKMVRTTYVIRESARDKLIFAKRVLGLKMNDILSDALDLHLDNILRANLDEQIDRLEKLKDSLEDKPYIHDIHGTKKRL